MDERIGFGFYQSCGNRGVFDLCLWPGKSLQLLCILPFVMLCLSAINMMFVKIMLAVCMLVGMVV